MNVQKLRTNTLTSDRRVRALKVSILYGIIISLGTTPLSSTLDKEKTWTLEKVLHRHAQAHGDATLRQNLKSIRIRGQLKTPQGDYDWILIKKRPNRARLTLLSTEGLQKVRAYDGQHVWEMTEHSNIRKPQIHVLPPAKAHRFVRDTRFFGYLLDQEGSDIHLEFVGRTQIYPHESIDEVPTSPIPKHDKHLKAPVECLHLRAVVSDSIRMEFFLNIETLMETKIISQEWDGQDWQTYVHYLSDYREFGPIQEAFRVDTYKDNRFHSALRLTDVGFNIGIYSHYFSRPPLNT